MIRRRLPWLLLAALVLTQVGYPLTAGGSRTQLTVATVAVGYLLSVTHAVLTRGPSTAANLVLVTTGGGLVAEAVGVTTGMPFGGYEYAGTLGPEIAGVPLVIPLAWTWMAWPAWLATLRLVGTPAARIVVAGLALAAWDIFLDPQMVAEGHWSWRDPTPALPGVPGVPVGNYLGWLAVAVVMMALLSLAGGRAARRPGADGPMYALYLWTYAASLLAHGAFLGLSASAGWGGLVMGIVAVPLAVTLIRSRSRSRSRSGYGYGSTAPEPARRESR